MTAPWRRADRRTILLTGLLKAALGTFLIGATWSIEGTAELAELPPAAAHPSDTGAETGAWSALFPFPTIPIHASLLPTGRVLFWDRHNVVNGDGHPRLWDPASGDFTLAKAPPPGHDLFCSGHAFLEDGRLFVAGGHFGTDLGQPFVATYDPFLGVWSLAPEMHDGRWYPTVTTLADGNVLVLAGSDENGAANGLPQIYRPLRRDWLDLEAAERVLPYYPRTFLGPDGRAFVAGPLRMTSRLELEAGGAWSAVADSGHGPRSYGSAVIYGPGKVLLAGGGDPPTAATQTIDLLQPSPQFRELSPMAFARRQMNLTLLPDGSVLATGGSSSPGFNNAEGAVLAAELWDPTSEHWTEVAPMAVPRLYHSIALLLPDGRVLSAGGGHPSDSSHGDPDHFDGQVYSPPYLFRGPRPTILNAPASIGFGETLELAFAPEVPVAAVNWVRLGSVTHGFDMNQRFLRLAPKGTGPVPRFTAPADPLLAPPGHYLMFALTADGVPSVGRIVQLTGGLFRDGFNDGSTAAWETGPP